MGHPPIRDWYERLARRHTLVRLDRRGCGLSDRDAENLDIWGEALDSLAVLDALAIERAIVFVLPSSNPHALHLASEFPQRVAALVLFNTLGGLGPAAQRALWASATADTWHTVTQMRDAAATDETNLEGSHGPTFLPAAGGSRAYAARHDLRCRPFRRSPVQRGITGRVMYEGRSASW